MNTLFWAIPMGILVVAVIVLLVLVLRKIPQLRVINTDETAKAKAKRVKEEIILERIRRWQGTKLEKMYTKTKKGFQNTMKFGRRSVQRLKALEQYYEDLKEAPVANGKLIGSGAIDRMLKEAAELVKQEKFGAAEKKYVEVITHDAKNVKAYEDLGRLYIRRKEPDQAKEAFNYILSFKPDDASVMASLGEIAFEEKDFETALEYFERAVTKRPANPKYLDFLIDTALRLEEIEPAMRGIDLLKTANPDNKKIAEFETRLKEIDVTPGS
jgi:Flp pilus assembly protein TadD